MTEVRQVSMTSLSKPEFPKTFTHACTNTPRPVPAKAPVVDGFKAVRCGCGDTVFVAPIERLAQLRREAVESFEAAVLDAHADGVSISDLARESGLSRQAIYDLIERRR